MKLEGFGDVCSIKNNRVASLAEFLACGYGGQATAWCQVCVTTIGCFVRNLSLGNSGG